MSPRANAASDGTVRGEVETGACESGDHVKARNPNDSGQLVCGRCGLSAQTLKSAGTREAFVGDMVVVCRDDECAFGYEVHSHPLLAQGALRRHQRAVEGTHDCRLLEVNSSDDVPNSQG